MQNNLREVFAHLYTGYAIQNLNIETGIHFGVISGNVAAAEEKMEAGNGNM